MASSQNALLYKIRRFILNQLKWNIGLLYLLCGAPGSKRKLFAFVFHEVGDEPRGHARLTGTYSTKNIFLKQISLLSDYFDFIDPSKDPLWVNKPGCLITFDDGYKGSLEAAMILETQKIASIHLVNLKTINGEINSSALIHFSCVEFSKELNWKDSTPKNVEILSARLTEPELTRAFEFSGPYLDPTEFKALSSLTYTVVGDHFLNHWYGNSLTNEEIIENLSLDTKDLMRVEEMRPYFAAPHGKLDNLRIEQVCAQDYEVVFAGSSWMKVGSTHVIPRIDLNNSIKSKFSLFGAIAILVLKSKIKFRS